MKLLVDENLSYKLVAHLNDLFPGSVRLSQVGLCRGTNDRAIWQYAKEHGFVIVTADNDFLMLSKTLGQPPKIVLLANCDYPTEAAARLINANAIRISEFERNDRPLLILRS